MHNVVLACESQVSLISIGIDNIQLMSDEAVEKVRSVIKSATNLQPLDRSDRGEETLISFTSDDERLTDGKERLKKWKIWDLEFEAQMRTLDNAVSEHDRLIN